MGNWILSNPLLYGIIAFLTLMFSVYSWNKFDRVMNDSENHSVGSLVWTFLAWSVAIWLFMAEMVVILICVVPLVLRPH